MLKRVFLAAGMVLGLQAGAWAVIEVDSFRGYAKGPDVQFSITAHNVEDVSQQGPIKIKVLSTTDGNKWTELQSYNLENLDAGAGWAQKFTASGEAAKARGKFYEAKIVIEYPGDEKATDKVERNADVILEGKK